jgi:hypothetical protein
VAKVAVTKVVAEELTSSQGSLARRADLNGSLSQFLNLPLEPEERQLVNSRRLTASSGFVAMNCWRLFSWRARFFLRFPAKT